MFKPISKAPSSPWNSLAMRRLQALSPTEISYDFDAAHAAFCDAAKQVGPGITLTVIKSFTNSLVTFHRFHAENLLGCIFGCEGCEDTLSHYLLCDLLWTAIICTCTLRSEWLTTTPAQKLGLVSVPRRHSSSLPLPADVTMLEG